MASGVADRDGDISSVFVQIKTATGAPMNAGYNICLF